MTIITDKLPPLWWLNPWSLAIQLHKTVRALKADNDRFEQDRGTYQREINGLLQKIEDMKKGAVK